MQKYKKVGVCVKCGNKSSTKGVTDKYVREGCLGIRNEKIECEVIQRLCLNCQYEWYELPRDAIIDGETSTEDTDE